MKSTLISIGILTGILMPAFTMAGQCGPKLQAGEATILYDFVSGVPGTVVTPEGIAFDQVGNMYISLRTGSQGVYIANEILKISPKGDWSVLTDLGPAMPGGAGVLGLETDMQGNVYVAFASFNALHGVVKVYPDGSMEHLPGSENMVFPDGLTMDRHGNLYATDGDPTPFGQGSVWKYSLAEGTFTLWADHVLLKPDGPAPDGSPLVGANGIAFDPPNHMYVANTQLNLLLHFEVLPDGSAGAVSVVAAGPPLLNPDGLALDAMGNVYAAIPLSTFPPDFFPLPPVSPVLRIIPETGEMQPILDPVNFPDMDYFDFPTSLAFGKGPCDNKSVYVVSMGASNFGFPFGFAPKLTQVGVGMPGQTGQ